MLRSALLPCACTGPVAPEDTWAEMKDSTEEIRGRSGSRVKVYAAVALVAVAVRWKNVTRVLDVEDYGLNGVLLFRLAGTSRNLAKDAEIIPTYM